MSTKTKSVLITGGTGHYGVVDQGRRKTASAPRLR